MSAPIAYLSVVLIWSTTPLTIKWSSGDEGDFLFGAFARMAIGTIVSLAVLLLLRIPLCWHRKACYTYMISGLGAVGMMSCVYWAAQFAPSGLISVVFGLTPFSTSLMAAIWLDEKSLTLPKLSGLVISIIGLYAIFQVDAILDAAAIQGLLVVCISLVIHSASSVWVKRIDADVSPLSVTAGTMLFALPFLTFNWVMFGQGVPADISLQMAGSILYLGVIGSVVGFVCYFYILKRMDATKVALITLMTPVLALLIGQWLNSEIVTMQIWLGTAIVISGLVLHQWGDQLLAFVRPARLIG